jgi:integrase
LTIAGDSEGEEAVYFKAAEVRRIIANSREPYRTMFVLAAVTDLRAGELLGLTAADIDFERLMICPCKQADDRSRPLRELKTKKSRTPVPITQQTATVLRNYLRDRWKQNPQGSTVSKSQRSALQVGKRREVWITPGPQETGTSPLAKQACTL